MQTISIHDRVVHLDGTSGSVMDVYRRYSILHKDVVILAKVKWDDGYECEVLINDIERVN